MEPETIGIITAVTVYIARVVRNEMVRWRSRASGTDTETRASAVAGKHRPQPDDAPHRNDALPSVDRRFAGPDQRPAGEWPQLGV